MYQLRKVSPAEAGMVKVKERLYPGPDCSFLGRYLSKGRRTSCSACSAALRTTLPYRRASLLLEWIWVASHCVKVCSDPGGTGVLDLSHILACRASCGCCTSSIGLGSIVFQSLLGWLVRSAMDGLGEFYPLIETFCKCIVRCRDLIMTPDNHLIERRESF